MTYITTIKDYASKKSDTKQIFLICGFGGKIWQTKRLINLLIKNGYNIRAVDYTTDVLTKGDPQMLVDLVKEMHIEAVRFKKKVKRSVLLIGISLGGLISVNIIRRDKQFSQAVIITGGDIVKCAIRSQGTKVWPQTYEELANLWKSVNMYSDPTTLKHISSVMVLPIADQLIDPDDVRKEIALQKAAGNRMQLLERSIFGHVGTIIVETVLFPKRILRYIEMLK
jgi:esterase/lipase